MTIKNTSEILEVLKNASVGFCGLYNIVTVLPRKLGTLDDESLTTSNISPLIL